MTQISVLADLKSKPRGIIKQKTSKSIHLWFLKKSVLESNCKCFRKKVIWENSNLKPEIQIKKAPSKNRGNYPVNRIKNKREAVTVFFHFCLNKIWAAGQTHVCKHMYATRKVHIFSSLPKPETHFRYLQRHHRASALTGSINVIQNTIFTVYEVEF